VSQVAYGQSFVAVLPTRYCLGILPLLFLELFVTLYEPEAGGLRKVVTHCWSFRWQI
jgi:hypothetical protein